MLVRLDERGEEQVERALADVLTRLFRRIEWDAVPYLEKMLQSKDENILAAASATVGDLRFLDEDLFAETLRVLVDHEVAIVRRNLVPHLREYIRMFPDDHRGVLSTLWVDGDEVVATRLRELLMRLEEVDPTSFSMLLHRLKGESPAALERLWSVLIIRKAERVEGWKAYLEEGAEAPAVTPPKQENRGPSSNMEVELPSLANALSKLDGEE
jgi:hypothetical protein